MGDPILIPSLHCWTLLSKPMHLELAIRSRSSPQMVECPRSLKSWMRIWDSRPTFGAFQVHEWGRRWTIWAENWFVDTNSARRNKCEHPRTPPEGYPTRSARLHVGYQLLLENVGRHPLKKKKTQQKTTYIYMYKKKTTEKTHTHTHTKQICVYIYIYTLHGVYVIYIYIYKQ